MGARLNQLKRRFKQVLIAAIVIAVAVVGFMIFAAIQKANAIKVDVSTSAFRPGINQAAIKASDYKFVVVTFSVANHSGDSLSVDPQKQSYVTDGTGARYGASPLKLDNEFKPVQVAKDATHTGQMSYAVPKDASNLSLHLDLNADYSFKIGLSPTQ